MIALIPCLAFAAAVSYVVYQNYSTIQDLENAQKDLVGVEKTSNLISSLQVERGYSALFISSGQTLTKRLKELRGQSDEKLKDLATYVTDNQDSMQRYSVIDQLGTNIKSARNGVDSTSTKENAIQEYSQIVAKFISLENIDKSGVSSEAMSRLKNFILLEETSESMGLLRARLSSILKSDVPLSSSQFNGILRLKGTISAKLSSNSLKLFPETEEKIKNLQNKDHWQEVDRIFQKVIVQSSEGGFGEDGEEFFNTISKSVKGIKDISKSEIKTIKELIASHAATQQKSGIFMVITMILVLLGIAWLVYYLTIKTKQDLLGMLRNFERVSHELIETSTALSHASKEMNLSSISQSSSIEETAASVEQIAAMTKNNLDRAHLSSESSKSVSKLAEQSSESMVNLIKSIEKIEESNKQVQNISQLISGISDKTDMIDEIVLQTKLLSFNASVEAERAGEYGRGFSVVASEVGKLAQVSGKSAVEISAIVTKAVKESDSIATENSKRVSTSSQLVKEYSKTLTEIRESAKSLSEKAEEVLNASNEQSTGLNQINDALQQLDEVNQKNKAAADDTASTSTVIQQKAFELDGTVVLMRKLLGRDKTSPAGAHNRESNSPSIGQRTLGSSSDYKKAS